MNLSRAVGPALGDALYAASSAAALFFVNAVSFVPVIGAVARWRGRAHPASAAAPEHFAQAMRAGARYVAASPALRADAGLCARQRSGGVGTGDRRGRVDSRALSTLNSQYQSTLPGWAKARGMSYYLVIFQGGGALGSAAFGVLAQNARLTGALLLAAAVGLALVALAGVWLPFRAISPQDLLPAGDWPDP